MPMRTGVSEMSNKLMIPKFCSEYIGVSVLCPEQLQPSRHLAIQLTSTKTESNSPINRRATISTNLDNIYHILMTNVCRNLEGLAIRRMVMKGKVDGLDKLGKVRYVEMSIITSKDTDAQYPKRMYPIQGLRLRVLVKDEGYPRITNL